MPSTASVTTPPPGEAPSRNPSRTGPAGTPTRHEGASRVREEEDQLTRDLLHLAAIQDTWYRVGLGDGTDLDWADIENLMYEFFKDKNGGLVIDHMCDNALDLLKEAGLTVEHDDGDLINEVLNAVTTTLCLGIWFGLTEGHVNLIGSPHARPKWFRSFGPLSSGGSR